MISQFDLAVAIFSDRLGDQPVSQLFMAVLLQEDRSQGWSSGESLTFRNLADLALSGHVGT